MKTKREMIAAAIAGCRDKDGNIRPKRVVQAARNKNSVLHDEFEWNETVLVQQALEARAAELIRQCRDIIVYGERKLISPTYISNPSTPDSSYIRTLAVAKNASMKTLALEAELARIRSAIHRAMSLALVFSLEDQFEQLLEQVSQIEIALMRECKAQKRK